jgi:hypothetical protein
MDGNEPKSVSIRIDLVTTTIRLNHIPFPQPIILQCDLRERRPFQTININEREVGLRG